MLRLQRKKGQRIIVGSGPDAVAIEIVNIGRGVVGLGIVGPAHISVDREEVRERKTSCSFTSSSSEAAP